MDPQEARHRGIMALAPDCLIKSGFAQTCYDKGMTFEQARKAMLAEHRRVRPTMRTTSDADLIAGLTGAPAGPGVDRTCEADREANFGRMSDSEFVRLLCG